MSYKGKSENSSHPFLGLLYIIFSEVAAKPKLVGYYAFGVKQGKPTLVSDPSIGEGYKLQ